MTTSRAGGLHKPPWGISHAEPIGSSNDPPLAEVAPLPQMWQLSFSLPLHKGASAAAGTVQSESFLEPPALLVVFVI